MQEANRAIVVLSEAGQATVFCTDMCGERARSEKFFSMEASKLVVKKRSLIPWRDYGKSYYRRNHVIGRVYE